MSTTTIDAPTKIDREAWRFFLDNAGYGTPPGRVACAAALARVEARAEREEMAGRLRFVWEYDSEPVAGSFDFGDDRENERYLARFGEDGDLDSMVCALQTRRNDCGQWDTQDSLCGIHILRFENKYQRVVQAELASEHFI